MAVALKPLVEIRPSAKPSLAPADFDALPAGSPDDALDRGRLPAMSDRHPRHLEEDAVSE